MRVIVVRCKRDDQTTATSKFNGVKRPQFTENSKYPCIDLQHRKVINADLRQFIDYLRNYKPSESWHLSIAIKLEAGKKASAYDDGT